MELFTNQVLAGIATGAIYACMALAVVMIYQAIDQLNFAQGEMAMFSTFIVWTVWDLGVPLPLAVIAGMLGGFGVGALAHQIAVRPVGDPHEKPLAVVMVTIGLFVGLNAAAQLVWGTLDRDLPPLFGNDGIEVAGVAIAWQKIGAVIVLAVLALGFYLLFQRTGLGLAMRAVASNSESASLVGVPVPKLLMLGWGLAAAVGTVAGVFTAPGRGLGSNMMQLTLIFGFAAITLGGFDSLLGAVVGGFVVGIASSVVPQYVPGFEKMPLAPAFILILAVLLFRPEGLFGRKQVQRV